MITHSEGTTTIKCDKCGVFEAAPTDRYNEVFSKSLWGLFPRARKYIHKCYKCMSVAHRRSAKWALEHFPPKTINNA
jgi:hypothetical protein